jgi:hypothetical protein
MPEVEHAGALRTTAPLFRRENEELTVYEKKGHSGRIRAGKRTSREVAIFIGINKGYSYNFLVFYIYNCNN